MPVSSHAALAADSLATSSASAAASHHKKVVTDDAPQVDVPKPWPAALRSLAANMSAATRSRLYVRGAGVWAAHVSGGAPADTPVPTVVDFAHVARLLRPDLDAGQRAEPAAFFFAQLLFPPWTGWLRALATPDGAGSRRADHGTTGAYTAWASLAAEALAFSDGNWSRAITLFSRFSPALRLGPLGQAGQVQQVGAANDTLHAVYKAPQWPFVNTAGANFADVILRSLFGFAPKWAARVLDDVPLTPALGQGGFVGRLDHLRTPAGLASVDSDGTRLVWALEARGGAAATPHASGGKPPARRRRALPAGQIP